MSGYTQSFIGLKNKVMQQSVTFIGIDISKLTLDICLLQGIDKQHYTIANELISIKEFFCSVSDPENLCIGMENTGYYNYLLYQALGELGLSYYVIPPLHLKKSLGLSRGKNDKIDAMRIALFMEANMKKLSVYKPKRTVVVKLQLLLTVREQRIKVKKQVQANKEHHNFASDESASLNELDRQLLEYINEQIKSIERQIDELVQTDSELCSKYKLIVSVQGVGRVLAWNLLVRTGEFENICSPRKLACFAGIAPFEYRSGTSIRGRSRTSIYADLTLKKLLHLAAMSVIRLTGDLKDYYQRKVTEGKNKMSVLNAVRNKIIHRIYAVLKHQRPYQKYLSESLVMS